MNPAPALPEDQSRRDPGPVRAIRQLVSVLEATPHSLIAILGRFSIAAVSWKSGQTKIEGLAIDLVDGRFDIGWPHLSESALTLSR
jgi:putative oxidoreductase